MKFTQKEITLLRDRICQACQMMEDDKYEKHLNCRRIGDKHDCYPQSLLDRLENKKEDNK